MPAAGVGSFADLAGALTIEGLGETLTGLGGQTGVPASIAAVVAASGSGFDDDGGDFDMLLAAVGAAGLVGALADEDASLTVFAPTDDPFVALAGRLGYGGDDEADAFEFIVEALTDLGGGDPIPLLTDVLSYHVVAGASTLGEFQAEGVIETSAGGLMRIVANGLIDADPDFENAQMFDQVLLPLDL